MPLQLRKRFGQFGTCALQIAATAPDPAGGLPYGLLAAPAKGGGWCVAALGRALSDRVGVIDSDLDILHANTPTATDCPQRFPAGQLLPRSSRPPGAEATLA
ncbi:MAG: hypothetical protein JWO02_119 [Solirubrobacterales bacterium]|nr:hypothetical protein [Solirubrobacterales bacterium]